MCRILLYPLLLLSIMRILTKHIVDNIEKYKYFNRDMDNHVKAKF